MINITSVAGASEDRAQSWQPLFFLKRKQRRTEMGRKEAAPRGVPVGRGGEGAPPAPPHRPAVFIFKAASRQSHRPGTFFAGAVDYRLGPPGRLGVGEGCRGPSRNSQKQREQCPGRQALRSCSAW